MQHGVSQPRKPLPHHFPSGKLVGETELARQVPVGGVAGQTVQHACDEGIACAYRAAEC